MISPPTLLFEKGICLKSMVDLEGDNDKHDENKKIHDFKDILATPNDEDKLTCNECDFTMLQNQALKCYNIEVIDMKEMISVNNVDIKHPRKMI